MQSKYEILSSETENKHREKYQRDHTVLRNKEGSQITKAVGHQGYIRIKNKRDIDKERKARRKKKRETIG